VCSVVILGAVLSVVEEIGLMLCLAARLYVLLDA